MARKKLTARRSGPFVFRKRKQIQYDASHYTRHGRYRPPRTPNFLGVGTRQLHELIHGSAMKALKAREDAMRLRLKSGRPSILDRPYQIHPSLLSSILSAGKDCQRQRGYMYEWMRSRTYG